MKPEEEAREKIDDLLELAGWKVQDYKERIGACPYQSARKINEERNRRSMQKGNTN